MVATRTKNLTTDPVPVWTRPGVIALTRLASSGELSAQALADILARDLAADATELSELTAFLRGCAAGAELARRGVSLGDN